MAAGDGHVGAEDGHACSVSTCHNVGVKYSTNNLHDCEFPLRGRVRILVDFRPGGELRDYRIITTSDPEMDVD
jgi:hypothetical protein